MEETRARILAAAREVLTSSDRYAEFSIPGVARAADVVRVTVYNQFGSKAGLLEALSDDLARHGGLHQLAAVVTEGDPAAGIGRFVAVFTGFWQSDRLVIRRLRALALADGHRTPDQTTTLIADLARRALGVTDPHQES